MCLAEEQMTCGHPKTNSCLSPTSTEVFLEPWVSSVSFHFTQTKLDVYMVRKMFYAFCFWSHGLVSINIFLCWGWSHKGGSVSKPFLFSFFKDIDRNLGLMVICARKRRLQISQECFQDLNNSSVCVRQGVIRPISIAQSWSMTSSSGMSGDTHTSGRKSPSCTKSKTWCKTYSAVTVISFPPAWLLTQKFCHLHTLTQTCQGRFLRGGTGSSASSKNWMRN